MPVAKKAAKKTAPAIKLTRKAPLSRTSYIANSNVSFSSEVPVPEMEEALESQRKGRYPFAELKIGESFSYPLLKSSEEKIKQRNALCAAIRKYKERNPRAEFVFRLLDRENIVRVWRVRMDFFNQK